MYLLLVFTWLSIISIYTKQRYCFLLEQTRFPSRNR
ncbi:hypothetical protein EVA_01816 [gut metagenome]|uniref:Uncharacterized protein n=1 Tax=gut metagenome TaxID=749906 RepID=J9H2J4_9ZZZZ